MLLHGLHVLGHFRLPGNVNYTFWLRVETAKASTPRYLGLSNLIMGGDQLRQAGLVSLRQV